MSNPTSGGTANGVGYRRISSVGSFLNVENQYVYIRYELGSNNTTSWLGRCLWITSTSALKNYIYSDNSSELISSFNSTNISKLNDGSYKVSLNIGAESYAGEEGAYPSNQPTAIYTCNVESNIVTSVAFSNASSLEFYVYSGARIRGVITGIRAS